MMTRFGLAGAFESVRPGTASVRSHETIVPQEGARLCEPKTRLATDEHR
jgi:hypothetical protein